MGYDKRWHDVAEGWIYDAEISLNRKHVEALIPKLAQRLADVAQDFLDETQRELGEAHEAASDADWDRRMDEATGK